MATAFPFPIAAHCLLVNSGHPKLAHQHCLLSLSSLMWLVSHCGPVTNVVFKAHKTTDPVSNWTNIYGVITTHTLLRCKWTGMQPSTVRNSITTLCLVHISTILHCCCVEHMGLTAALMILVELDSHYPVSKAGNSTQYHVPKKKIRGIIFVLTFIYGSLNRWCKMLWSSLLCPLFW